MPTDPNLPICPFRPGSIGVAFHSESQQGPNAGARCLIPRSLPLEDGQWLWEYSMSRTIWEQRLGWLPVQLSSSGCVWLPEQLLRVRGTDWRRSKNVCEGRWGEDRRAGWQATDFAAVSAYLPAELDIEGFRDPLPLPFCSLWVEHEISKSLGDLEKEGLGPSVSHSRLTDTPWEEGTQQGCVCSGGVRVRTPDLHPHRVALHFRSTVFPSPMPVCPYRGFRPCSIPHPQFMAKSCL